MCYTSACTNWDFGLIVKDHTTSREVIGPSNRWYASLHPSKNGSKGASAWDGRVGDGSASPQEYKSLPVVAL